MSDRPVRRLWMPIATIVIAVAAVFGTWKIPGADFTNDARSMTCWAVVTFAVFALIAWLLFFSGMRILKRLAIFAAVSALAVGTSVAAIDAVEFQGNLLPVIHWRWNRHVRSPRVSASHVAIPAATEIDFPEYRNRKRDGVVTGLSIGRDWTAQKPKELWRLAVTGGFGGISVVGPSAITLEQLGNQEAVICYDADTGHERWVYKYDADFREPLGGNGPRTNPTIADGDVYSLGATGALTRLDGKSGEKKWQVNILGEGPNLMWGMSGSPLVYDQFVVVNPGVNSEATGNDANRHSVVAYHRDSGTVAWSAGKRQAGYSSPQLATINDVPQVLIFDAVGLVSYDPANGAELWSYDFKTNYDVNAAQPLVFDDGRVYIVAGYGHGGAMLKITRADGKWSVNELWTSSKLKCKFSNPVQFKDHIFGIDEARGSLTCLDAKDGALKWKEGAYGNGQLLLVGDLLVIQSETGKLVIVEANPKEFREVAKMQVLPGEKNWNYLTVARGRAYLRSHEWMACLELPQSPK